MRIRLNFKDFPASISEYSGSLTLLFIQKLQLLQAQS